MVNVVEATPPIRRAPPQPFSVQVPPAFAPALILKVVADVVPAAISCVKVEINGAFASFGFSCTTAAKAFAVESWNNAVMMLQAVVAMEWKTVAVISKRLDALEGVMARVRTSFPSVFCGMESSSTMTVVPVATADVDA